jgi:hypothetical protein
MELIFLPDPTSGRLRDLYTKAFKEAIELFVVSAFLTDWDKSVPLGGQCKALTVIIGMDFGITKKAACTALDAWLPERFKDRFLVSTGKAVFHPKAIIWRDANGHCHAVVGSSNLTRAGFGHNVETNAYNTITSACFDDVVRWVRTIESASDLVMGPWFDLYKEAPRHSAANKKAASTLVFAAGKLPTLVKSDTARLTERREALAVHRRHYGAFDEHVRLCASGAMTSAAFYKDLHGVWGWERGNRLQGKGWERTGKPANFHALCQALLTVDVAADDERDDVVRGELDRLAHSRHPARRAFFTELLCLRYPKLYPIDNDPFARFLSASRFRAGRVSGEGARYVAKARWLRKLLASTPAYPARNLAELDILLWRKYGRKPRAVYS